MKWLKRIGIAVGVLVLLLVVAVGFVALRPASARAVDPSKKFEPTKERLERGHYLVTAVASCLLCHSEHDWKTHGAPILPGMTGAGWDVPYAENKMPGKVFAANITPDPETGIGAVPDDAIARTIREGVARDGHPIFMMPWLSYRNFSDEEVASVVVYLRSLAPVKKLRAPTEIDIPIRWMLKMAPKPLTAAVADPDQSDPVKRGKHLADIGVCHECHTPVDAHHKPLPGMDFAGGQEFRGGWGVARSANITPDASGIAHYNEALFIRTMRTGNIGGRRLSPLMPWSTIRNMTDDDLKALWAYLKTVKPVAHDVQREPVEVSPNPLIDEHPEVAAGDTAKAAAPGEVPKPGPKTP
jgi:mono/diheme cytochrome c family protein